MNKIVWLKETLFITVYYLLVNCYLKDINKLGKRIHKQKIGYDILWKKAPISTSLHTKCNIWIGKA